MESRCGTASSLRERQATRAEELLQGEQVGSGKKRAALRSRKPRINRPPPDIVADGVSSRYRVSGPLERICARARGISRSRANRFYGSPPISEQRVQHREFTESCDRLSHRSSRFVIDVAEARVRK